MEEMFEYLVPLTGLFKKKRNPKVIESYKKLDDFDQVVEDFSIAKSYKDDTIRIGKKCIFRKEKITIFYIEDIVKATFRIIGSDPSDESSIIILVFKDGSEEKLYETPCIDPDKVTNDIFPDLENLGIKTTFAITR